MEPPDAVISSESGVSSFLDDAESSALTGDYRRARALLRANQTSSDPSARFRRISDTVGVGFHARVLLALLTLAFTAVVVLLYTS